MNKQNPYFQLMRGDKPIGFFLLGWPIVWALTLVYQEPFAWGIAAVFLVGVIVTRAAGCIVNDLIDIKLDRQVQRTQHRPLASGALSKKQALSCLAVLTIIACALLIPLNLQTRFIAFCSAFLIILYPATKYFFPAPQIILGITFNLGVLMTFTALTATLSPMSIYLYCLAIIWTLIYDTEYAMADKPCDVTVGIYSTAILFAECDKLFIGLLQSIFLAGFVLLGINLEKGSSYFFGIGLTSLSFLYQQYLIKNRSPERCLQAFINNNLVGALIFLSLL